MANFSYFFVFSVFKGGLAEIPDVQNSFSSSHIGSHFCLHSDEKFHLLKFETSNLLIFYRMCI